MAALGAARQAEGGEMNTLPYFQTQPTMQSVMQALGLLNSQWRSILNPLLGVTLTSGLQLSNIAIKTGVNVINTTLARTQQGWWITDIDANETFYRSAPFNSSTLTLTSTGACTISLWVY